jgi:hypothetical protein
MASSFVYAPPSNEFGANSEGNLFMVEFLK